MSTWRKGGYTCNGLRESTNVRNYFNGPGRMNILPDATSGAAVGGGGPISSIGVQSLNPNTLVSSGTYGPGTLLSSNVQLPYGSSIPNEGQQGIVIQNDKRTQFIDWRSTAPFLIEQLRQNPLSAYRIPEASKNEIPAFYTYVRPDSYETYYTKTPNPSQESIRQAINGNAQASILGLGRKNPLLGLEQRVAETPKFLGKSYGGNSNTVKNETDYLYNQMWTDNFLTPGPKCMNKALPEFAQGYNVAPQINQQKQYIYYPTMPVQAMNQPYNQIWTKGNNPNPMKLSNGIVTNSVTSPPMATPYTRSIVERFAQTTTTTPTTTATTTTTTVPTAPAALDAPSSLPTSDATPTVPTVPTVTTVTPTTPTVPTTTTVTPTTPTVPVTTGLVTQPNYNNLAAAIQGLEKATETVLTAATQNISG